MSMLSVLSEDYNILPYLHRNGLYPNNLFFRSSDMLESATFVDEDCLFLVIIHGFSRFSAVELMHLFSSLADLEDSGLSVVVMSDIPIKSPDLHSPIFEYVQYKGDLFFGEYTWFNRRWKPVRDTVEEDEKTRAVLNGALPASTKVTKYREEFWSQFLEFTDTSVETNIGELPEAREKAPDPDEAYFDKLITLNIYE